ncbi:MAG: hypothetical protein JW791_03820 [Nanoarchaeota archaeon]|nr:hypothetical protein [Nanoarchaeota archaeon]
MIENLVYERIRSLEVAPLLEYEDITGFFFNIINKQFFNTPFFPESCNYPGKKAEYISLNINSLVVYLIECVKSFQSIAEAYIKKPDEYNNFLLPDALRGFCDLESPEDIRKEAVLEVFLEYYSVDRREDYIITLAESSDLKTPLKRAVFDYSAKMVNLLSNACYPVLKPLFEGFENGFNIIRFFDTLCLRDVLLESGLFKREVKLLKKSAKSLGFNTNAGIDWGEVNYVIFFINERQMFNELVFEGLIRDDEKQRVIDQIISLMPDDRLRYLEKIRELC